MPVEKELSLYEEYVARLLDNGTPQMGPLLRFVSSNHGKAVRPLIVLLTAGLFPDKGDRQERAVLAAVLVEMVHTASLIHDDIIDESYVRRGRPSVNAFWGDHKAVLLGDYIIGRAFADGLRTGHYDIVQCVTESMYSLCEGEIIQAWQSDQLGMTREIYLDIIFKKTALVLGVASSVGVMAARGSEADVERMRQYGNNLGIAFQIRDDVLDYAPLSQTGKPACGDLRERKINMPLLALLEKSPAPQRRALLAKLSDVRRHPENVEYLRQAVIDGGGIDDASASMEEYLAKARAALESYEPSACRSSLFSLCDYIALRDR